MSLFQNLAEIFAILPPRRPRRGQPDDQQRPDVRSPQLRGHYSLATGNSSHSPVPRPSRHIPSPRRRYSPGPQLDDARLSVPPNRDSAARLQSAQSYDSNLPPTPGPANIREQLRAPPSQFVIDLSACGSDAPQMFGNNQKRNDAQARQEEARLLGARDYKDKDAVPITPGATLGRRKIPGSSGAFKPTDRISQNARDSGPVRASGKPNPSASYLNRNRPQLEDAPDFEESARPNKRRRHDAAGQQLDLTEEASVKSGSSAATQTGAKHKSNGWNPRQHEEFRGVEQSIRVDRSPRSTRRTHHDRLSSADSYDEKFPSAATQQRRSLANTKERPRQAKIAAIEVPKSKGTTSEKAPDEPESDRQNCASSTGTRRVSERGESPDELQGEATTQPIPKYLGERQHHSRKIKNNMPSPMRKRSPSDIQRTDFARSLNQRSKKAKHNEKRLKNLNCLALHSLRFGSVNKRRSEETGLLWLYIRQDNLELEEEKKGAGKEVEVPLRHIQKVVQGIGRSRKVRLSLSGFSDAQEANHIDLEFTDPDDKEQLVERLRDMQTKIQDKEDSYLEKAFANSEREWAQHGSHTKKPLLEIAVPEPAPSTSASSATRRKLSSALQDSAGESSENRKKAKSNTQGTTDGANESKQSADRQKGESGQGVEIPVKKFRPPEPEREGRATRRTTRIAEKTTPRDDEALRLERQPSPTNDPARQKWKKPLVYPRIGKKKAEVSVEDRDRLRDDEFLNDNLIGFYMRFLQDHLERTNKQAAQRVYFFNSYFFDTLARTPKGERGINYSGVEKWTRSVDLFSYDYIVVPINQSAHWYVAIICNLPSLELGSAEPVEPSSAAVSDKETSIQPESEVQEILESPEPKAASSPAAPAVLDSEKETNDEVESPESQQARQSLATMNLGDGQAPDVPEKDEEASPAEEWPDEDENPSSPTVEFPNLRPRSVTAQEQSASTSKPGRKAKKKGKGGPKLSPDQPSIITFDSLGIPRSPTITMLREYICKEAASKRGVEVDPAAIKGRRAQQIPLQPNYSDCGLYLLAYVEKFVQDPDQFIRKLHQREMDQADDWPPLGSGLLRHRLRNFLDDLYDEQVRLKKDKAEETKPIMADQKPVSFLLGRSQLRKEDDGKAAGEHSETVNPSNSANTPEKSATKEEPARKQEDKERSDGPAADQPSLVPLKAESQSKSKKERSSPESSTPKDPASPKEQATVEVPDSQEKEEGDRPTQSEPEPKQWASKGAESPVKKSQRKKAATSADTDTVTVDDSLPKKKAEDSETLIQVHVRETPPPTEPERVRNSP